MLGQYLKLGGLPLIKHIFELTDSQRWHQNYLSFFHQIMCSENITSYEPISNKFYSHNFLL